MLESLKDKAPPDPCKRSNVDVDIEKYLKATGRDQSNVYLKVRALLQDIKAILYGQNFPSPKIDMLSRLTEHVLGSSAASWLTLRWNYGKELETFKVFSRYAKGMPRLHQSLMDPNLNHYWRNIELNFVPTSPINTQHLCEAPRDVQPRSRSNRFGSVSVSFLFDRSVGPDRTSWTDVA